MSSKISSPYVFSKSELALIKKNYKVHKDWDKQVFDDIRENLRDFLRPKQNNKCCYCKTELGFDIKAVDIEHIIPKAKFKQFGFVGLNLALACPGCNTKKGEKDVSNKVVRYPKHSKNITIIHSHYDDYNKHIKIHGKCVYEALSKKGSHTITICELFRLKKAEEKARKVKMVKKKAKKLIKKAENATPVELMKILKKLKKIIK